MIYCTNCKNRGKNFLEGAVYRLFAVAQKKIINGIITF